MLEVLFLAKKSSKLFVLATVASILFTVGAAGSLAHTYYTAQQMADDLTTRTNLIQQYTDMESQVPSAYVSADATQVSSLMDAAITAAIPTQISGLDVAYDMMDVCDDQIQERIEEYKKEQAELQAKKAAEEAQAASAAVASQMASRPGMVGRLTIPSLGINVALFASNSQAVVDAPDSAACFGFGSATVIGDHQNQGFSAIRSSYVGMTAYIDDGTSKRQLTCTGVTTGTNTGTDLVSSSGVSVSTYGGYVMYTCNSNWQDVTIVYFS